MFLSTVSVHIHVPVLILFSVELRDITQDTEYVMNFYPCDLSVPSSF